MQSCIVSNADTGVVKNHGHFSNLPQEWNPGNSGCSIVNELQTIILFFPSIHCLSLTKKWTWNSGPWKRKQKYSRQPRAGRTVLLVTLATIGYVALSQSFSSFESLVFIILKRSMRDYFTLMGFITWTFYIQIRLFPVDLSSESPMKHCVGGADMCVP